MVQEGEHEVTEIAEGVRCQLGGSGREGKGKKRTRRKSVVCRA